MSSSCNENLVTAGAIAGGGGALTLAGKYITSDKVLNKVKANYERKLKIANAFEERYIPRVRFNYTVEDIEKEYRKYIAENQHRNGKEWTENAKRNLDNFVNTQKKMNNNEIGTRIKKSIVFKRNQLPEIGKAHSIEELWLIPKPDELFGDMDKYFKRLKAEYIPGRVKTAQDVEFLKRLRQKPFLLSGNSKLKFITNLILGATVIGAGYFASKGLNLFNNKSNITNNKTTTETVEQPTDSTQQIKIIEKPEHKDLKQKFEDGFKELGISDNTELKEYIPQKGEYWISILKAKYDVDDITAQKMANKIKQMVYDDPKASKQTPVMYLPETWNFDGKTYKYNEKAPVQTTNNYSDDVKTEMGKMDKKIKY